MPPFRDGMFSAAAPVNPDIEIVSRLAAGNPGRLPALATELVAMGVRAILAVSPAAVRAARNATATIPIVAHDLKMDPIANGWAASIARPGGNITGLFLDLPRHQREMPAAAAGGGTGAKGRDLVGPGDRLACRSRQSRPRLRNSAPPPRSSRCTARTSSTASSSRLSRDLAGGVLMLSSPIVGTNPGRVAALALAHKLPAITLFAEFAHGGGLLSYGPDTPAMYRQAGIPGAQADAGRKSRRPADRAAGALSPRRQSQIRQGDRHRRADVDPGPCRRRGDRVARRRRGRGRSARDKLPAIGQVLVRVPGVCGSHKLGASTTPAGGYRPCAAKRRSS